MTEFRRYKSIENHYQEKNIRDMLAFNPMYHTCRYVATEKIHGSNFQINLIPDHESGGVYIRFGKRSGWLTEHEQFYNYTAVTNRPEYQQLIDDMCNYIRASEDITELTLYGELAGPGIQTGVEYGPDKFIKFFDVTVNGEYFTPKEFFMFMLDIGHDDKVVPVVKIFDNINEALAFNVEGAESILFKETGNVWEGVVIKPYDVIARNKDDEQVLFYIKMKDTKFKDRQTKSRDKKNDIPKELDDAQHAFSEFLTEIRLQDVFSKHGMIESNKDIGTYIKYMMEDAKEDYFKDCMDIFNAVPDKHKGKVFSITGKVVAPMMMKYV